MVVDWFRRYLMPAFVFQSIIIAGGYGTGRELVEFFLHFGPLGGLLAMIPATLLTSVTCLVAFELARVTRSYDYRSRQIGHKAAPRLEAPREQPKAGKYQEDPTMDDRKTIVGRHHRGDQEGVSLQRGDS